jgi:hypothetical protein
MLVKKAFAEAPSFGGVSYPVFPGFVGCPKVAIQHTF